MKIQKRDHFSYKLNNGLPATVEVISTIQNKVAFRHIQDKAGVGSVSENYFEQLVNNGYFKKE